MTQSGQSGRRGKALPIKGDPGLAANPTAGAQDSLNSIWIENGNTLLVLSQLQKYNNDLLPHPPPGEDDCWKGGLARLSTPGHQLHLAPITHPCLIHGNPQSPFVCGQREPGQLEGPGLALSSELAERYRD